VQDWIRTAGSSASIDGVNYMYEINVNYAAQSYTTLLPANNNNI